MEVNPPIDQYSSIETLPGDIIGQLLLSMDWQTATHYCQISSRVRKICKEGIWKRKLNKDFPNTRIKPYPNDINNYLANRFIYVENRINDIDKGLKNLPSITYPITEDFYRSIPPQKLKALFNLINEERSNMGELPLKQATSTKTNYFERNSEIYGIPVAKYVGDLYAQLQNYIKERNRISSIQYNYLLNSNQKPEVKTITIPENILNLANPNYRGIYPLDSTQEINLRKYLKNKNFKIGDIAVINIPNINSNMYYLVTQYPSQHILGSSIPDVFTFYIRELGLTERDANKLYGL